MTSFVKVLTIGLRAIAGAALLLGVAFWLGYARELTRVHMGLGSLLILCLWILTIVVWVGARRHGLAALAIAWGLATWVFGLFQAAILPGPWHWVVEVAHPASAIVAVAIGGQLASVYLRDRSTR
jgi:hypothetical protein